MIIIIKKNSKRKKTDMNVSSFVDSFFRAIAPVKTRLGAAKIKIRSTMVMY